MILYLFSSKPINIIPLELFFFSLSNELFLFSSLCVYKKKQMEWIEREVEAHRPLPVAVLHSWVREQLHLKRGSYKLVQLPIETSSGRLTKETELPIQEFVLQPASAAVDKLVFVIMARIPKQRLAGRGAHPASCMRYYALSCSRRKLLPLLDTTLSISAQFLLSLQDEEAFVVAESHSEEQHSPVLLPYLYDEEDEIPAQLESKDIVKMVHSRLQLHVSLSSAVSSEAKQAVLLQAEQLFGEGERDKLSLHLCCGLLSALADVCLSKAELFSQCEELLFAERCRLRGVTATAEQLQQQRRAIAQDIEESSSCFLQTPLSPDSTHWTTVTEATAVWRQNRISLV